MWKGLYSILLYRHQWNTKWDSPRKLHIFTCEDNMLSSHVKRSPSLWLHNKSRLFHRSLSGVYIINRILHARLWIWILSSRVRLHISLVCCAHLWDIELNTQDKIHIHMRSCNILYISVYKPHTTHNSSIRFDEGLTLETSALESLYSGQLTLSTQLIKPNYQTINKSSYKRDFSQVKCLQNVTFWAV